MVLPVSDISVFTSEFLYNHGIYLPAQTRAKPLLSVTN